MAKSAAVRILFTISNPQGIACVPPIGVFWLMRRSGLRQMYRPHKLTNYQNPAAERGEVLSANIQRAVLVPGEITAYADPARRLSGALLVGVSS